MSDCGKSRCATGQPLANRKLWQKASFFRHKPSASLNAVLLISSSANDLRRDLREFPYLTEREFPYLTEEDIRTCRSIQEGVPVSPPVSTQSFLKFENCRGNFC
jgi:hypothetical protein